jgi:hypothetical protein
VHSSDVPYGGSARVRTRSTGAEVRRSDGDVVGWVDDHHYLVRTEGPSGWSSSDPEVC